MSGIFEADIFAGPRRGMYGAGALGQLPAGAAPISTLGTYRSMGWSTPSGGELTGRTHFTARQSADGTSMNFNFYDASGREVSTMIVYRIGADSPVDPGKETEAPIARRENDGILPSRQPEDDGSPGWLPWVLVGGGVLVAGGIVFMATRKPKPRAVAANRRRRSSRRRASRRVSRRRSSSRRRR